MGAGLSQKQIKSRIYNRLKTIQRNLGKAGVPVSYHNYQLCRFETANSPHIGGWNISFRTSRASNGEVAGVPAVYITNSIRGDFKFGGFDQDSLGSFDQGIAHLIQIFSEREAV